MTSLGNAEATLLASPILISFITVAIVYVTGQAQIHIGPSTRKFEFPSRPTNDYLHHGIDVRDALSD